MPAVVLTSSINKVVLQWSEVEVVHIDDVASFFFNSYMYSVTPCSFDRISHDTIFLSHNKTASAGL